MFIEPVAEHASNLCKRHGKQIELKFININKQRDKMDLYYYIYYMIYDI